MTDVIDRPLAMPPDPVAGLPPGAHLSTSSGNLYDSSGRLFYSEDAILARQVAAHQARDGECFPNCGCEPELDPFGLPLAYLNDIAGEWLGALSAEQLGAARCALDVARRQLEDFEAVLAPLIAALPPGALDETSARYRAVWE